MRDLAFEGLQSVARGLALATQTFHVRLTLIRDAGCAGLRDGHPDGTAVVLEGNPHALPSLPPAQPTPPTHVAVVQLPDGLQRAALHSVWHRVKMQHDSSRGCSNTSQV